MSSIETTPECSIDIGHKYCAGPQVIRREGAPEWEVPIMVIRCSCACHRRSAAPSLSK